MAEGRIVKGIAGFYYVDCGGAVYECKAKGIFRKDGTKPLPGDRVVISVFGEEGSIDTILPRKNELIRPSVANVDQALVVFAVKDPDPSFGLLDRMLIMMGVVGLPVLIVFNKEDLSSKLCTHYSSIYEKAGYRVLPVSARTGEGIDTLGEFLRGKTTTVAGPSGVGKSSILNALTGCELMQAGELSEKLGRGKHTTRHSELFRIAEDSYLIDTPGFGSLDLPRMGKDELQKYYPEFADYTGECRFSPCSHTHEPDCGVKRAVEKGLVGEERYKGYTKLYSELEQRGRI
ncbi:MAG: ribosome small subunit-dependent GTPase A [Lachnospiraceae bacterium]|nr:ribosome small subunit-dependent GTPase A [Lachnospiraceae bacterium]